jgi:hypothetical protein
MSIRLYFDHHMQGAIVTALRRRGVDVLTTAEDGTARLADPLLLDRATAMGRVVVSQDDDLLAEAKRRQIEGIPFAGVVYGYHLRLSIGDWIRGLELIALAMDPIDLQDQVYYLPL